MDLDLGEKRNLFIIWSFVDVADHDYIAARACWRLGLLDQFHWFGLQAMEKYLKAILLYNDCDTRKIGHDLTKGIQAVEAIPVLKWDFHQSLKGFLADLSQRGQDRYFVKPHGTNGNELLQLDRSVWHVRCYCVDPQSFDDSDGQNLENYVKTTQSDECRRSAYRFRLPSCACAHLEEVLDTDRFRGQRSILIWKNFFYGRRKKRHFKFTYSRSGKVPGHYFFPEIYPWVESRVTLDKEVKKHFQQHANDLARARVTACSFRVSPIQPKEQQ